MVFVIKERPLNMQRRTGHLKRHMSDDPIGTCFFGYEVCQTPKNSSMRQRSSPVGIDMPVFVAALGRQIDM
jgi:hypothetical protein